MIKLKSDAYCKINISIFYHGNNCISIFEGKFSNIPLCLNTCSDTEFGNVIIALRGDDNEYKRISNVKLYIIVCPMTTLDHL